MDPQTSTPSPERPLPSLVGAGLDTRDALGRGHYQLRAGGYVMVWTLAAIGTWLAGLWVASLIGDPGISPATAQTGSIVAIALSYVSLIGMLAFKKSMDDDARREVERLAREKRNPPKD